MNFITLGFGAIALFIGLIVLGAGAGVVLTRFYRKVDQGKALIINKMRNEPTVTFTGGIVFPIINRAEVMDISLKTIEISRDGHDGLICKDNIRADIKVTFFVRVNKTTEDVLKVAQNIGCERASKQETLVELFAAKFSEALKTVGKKLEFEQLYTQRDDFKDEIIRVIGRDLNGYVLDDCAIDYLEQTPLQSLNKDNVLDSRGIRKITEITAEQNLKTNDLRQNERKEITRQNLEADEAILELERRRADAEAKQHREIETVRAREAAETAKVQSEEHERAEKARIGAQQELEVAELNRQRQVEVADKDRERVVAIKAEQVQRDRELEEIARKREVERQEIDKEMELEVKRKEIAEVVRTRIVVDKNVAEEEERIKDLRATAEANRSKDVQVIGAQANAEEVLVKEIKGAEAAEKVAEFKAREKLTLANADLEAAERIAKSKIRIAEGVQAEEAASGLAAVKVKEANAVALEKEGLAEARVQLEKASAKAQGDEKQGLAEMTVRQREIELEAQLAREKAVAEAAGKEADAAAIAKMGAAEAAAIRDRKLAEAEGERAAADAMKQRLLAQAAGKEADAAATEKLLTAEAKGTEMSGLAEARAIEERMLAEAKGLAEKLAAMQKMEGAARDHEEFRLRLEHEEKVRLAAIAMQERLAAEQAKVLGTAFASADIKIMGGDGAFLDKFVQAASVGSAIDGFLQNSSAAQGLLMPFLSGQKSVGDGIADVIDAVTPKRDTLDPEKLLAAAKDDEERARIAALLEAARR
ncbi:MAG: hypothetical protein H6736_21595 [Alphaproteobacteria bacterium]|nr:hypothetical protein [Alphaproteobacteria bacterium]MCB9694412.1 hypothetical protein [Alphaproteobacteria bacterium]